MWEMVYVLYWSSIKFNTLSFHLKKFPNLKQQCITLFDFIKDRRLYNVSTSQFRPQFQGDLNPEPILQSLVWAITSCSSVSHCQVLHSQVVKSLSYSDEFMGDRLVSVYAELGCLEDAHKLFDDLPHKDLVSWNSLISVFSRRGDVCRSLNAFCKMRIETAMEPNEVTLISLVSVCTNSGALGGGNYIHGIALKMGLLFYTKVLNSLINMYGKAGCLASACQLFEIMLFPNLVSWNSIINIHVQNGCSEESILLFNSMRRVGVNPDRATMVTLLQGCADIGVGKLAHALHGYVLNAGLNEDKAIGTALLNVYAKLGQLKASHEIFGGMKDPDIIAWTAMLAGYAVHGYGREAIKLFDLMVKKGQEPDHVTFTHLLSACSHSGLVVEGKRYFGIMRDVYKIEPRLDHYSCMVDLLGRSGHLKDALVLIERMPIEPNSGVWGALLSACKVYRNVELGKEVAERLFALNPSDSRNYIMLSNIYSAAGQWRDASKVRALMKEKGLIRTPGCSFIEHGHKIHRFTVGDRTHLDSDRIYMKLEEIIEKIKEVGYVPITEEVVHNVDEEIKEDMIGKHSEKLAIAFGLMVMGQGMPLIITKNLRICRDCHSMAEFVSLIEERTIVIRDTKRFHHFADGLCSCGDHW